VAAGVIDPQFTARKPGLTAHRPSRTGRADRTCRADRTSFSSWPGWTSFSRWTGRAGRPSGKGDRDHSFRFLGLAHRGRGEKPRRAREQQATRKKDRGESHAAAFSSLPCCRAVSRAAAPVSRLPVPARQAPSPRSQVPVNSINRGTGLRIVFERVLLDERVAAADHKAEEQTADKRGGRRGRDLAYPLHLTYFRKERELSC
jgi:hypothetical protein